VLTSTTLVVAAAWLYQTGIAIQRLQSRENIKVTDKDLLAWRAPELRTAVHLQPLL
jgi:hypothetical protein